MAEALRPAVPFPFAGEGIVLFFSNADCAELQKRYGESWFLDAVPRRLQYYDIDFFRSCVEIGARKDGKKVKVDFEAIDAPLKDIGAAVIDALFYSVHGMSLGDFLIDLAKKEAEITAAKENPMNGSSPETTSPRSGDDASASASSPTSSGTLI